VTFRDASGSAGDAPAAAAKGQASLISTKRRPVRASTSALTVRPSVVSLMRSGDEACSLSNAR